MEGENSRPNGWTLEVSGKNRRGHNPERARQYREMLSTDIAYELDCLQTALEHDQRDELGRAAHTLKGLCGHLANREPANEGMICLSFNFSPEEFSLDAVTSKVMEWALQKCKNNKSSAARLLKASRKLFY